MSDLEKSWGRPVFAGVRVVAPSPGLKIDAMIKEIKAVEGAKRPTLFVSAVIRMWIGAADIPLVFITTFNLMDAMGSWVTTNSTVQSYSGGSVHELMDAVISPLKGPILEVAKSEGLLK